MAATPSDMTCYTPDPEDKSSDTLSPTGDTLSEPSKPPSLSRFIPQAHLPTWFLQSPNQAGG